MDRADLPPTSTIRRRGTSVVPILIVLLLSPFLIAAGDGAMVWVCKYVATPDGQHLTPAPGENPLRVSESSVNDGAFSDAHVSLVFDQVTAPDCVKENANPPPTTVCVGSIAATMVDSANVARTGSIAGTPDVALNGATTTDVPCGSYDYTATAPDGYRLTNAATQTATVTDGDTATVAWTLEQIIEPTCEGSIAATMVDSNDVARSGSIAGTPDVALNGATTTDVPCGSYDYTATAPDGYRLTNAATQTATVTDGDTATLAWTVEAAPLTCPSGTVLSEDGTTCVQPEGPVERDPVVEDEEVVEDEQDPVIVDDPKDPVVVEDPVVDDGEVVCEGGLGLRVTDLLGEPVPGASVALGDETHDLTGGQHEETLPCGSVEVELTSVPGGYVFVRTEIHGTSTLSAQSTHTKSRKVSAVVSDDAPSTVVFVVDPLEVMPVEITEPAPERDPLGAPDPAPAQDDPQPAPQPAPVEPVAGPTLPRTGIPAGRLLALAILMLTAGSAMVGSRRSVDR